MPANIIVISELLLLSTISHMTSGVCGHVGLYVFLHKSRIIDSLNTFVQVVVFDWTLLKTVLGFRIVYLLADLDVHIVNKL